MPRTTTSPPAPAVERAVFDRVLERGGTASMKWERYRGRDVLPFWVADMDFAVAEPIHRALHERIEHPVFGYTLAPEGLVEAVRAHLRRAFAWDIDPDWLLWLPGVVPGLSAGCRAFCADGDEVIVNPPIYHHFYDAHVEPGQRLLRVPLQRGDDGRWTWDMDAMRAAVTRRTRLLMLCSPHNPTGTVFRPDELEALGEFVREHDLVVISDEIHCDLVLDPDARHRPTLAACPGIADRCVTLMSASKTWNLAGLNCSFAIIADAALRQRFAGALGSAVPPVPPLAYVATEAAYRDGGPWRDALLDYLRGNLDLIEQRLAGLSGMTLEPLEATYLAWIDARALGVPDLQAVLEEHGIGLSSGEQFGQPGFLRLNFACPRQMLEQGLDRLCAAAEKLHRP